MDLAYQAYGPIHAINQLLLYIAVTVACHNIGPAKKGGRGGGGGLAVAPSFSPYVVNVMHNSTFVSLPICSSFSIVHCNCILCQPILNFLLPFFYFVLYYFLQLYSQVQMLRSTQ